MIIDIQPRIKNPIIKLSKCCYPIPGDNIISFFKSPNKVLVHKKSCRNVKESKGAKKIKVEWKKDYNAETDVKVFAADRVGLFADILNTIAATGTNITGAKGKMISEVLVEISFNIVPESLDHLEDILKRIQRIQGVRRISLGN